MRRMRSKEHSSCSYDGRLFEGAFPVRSEVFTTVANSAIKKVRRRFTQTSMETAWRVVSGAKPASMITTAMKLQGFGSGAKPKHEREGAKA